jgi:Domain of unknown function (DUF2017)
MLIRKWKQKAFEFSRIERIEAELLRQVPRSCEFDENSAVSSRIFPDPAAPTEKEFLEDWNELVRPELRRLFLSAKQIVESDLATLKTKLGLLSRFLVPLDHGEPWLNTLNQARLVLATKFEFTEAELSTFDLPRTFSERELVLHQINFYAAIQERLIEILMETRDGRNTSDAE